MEEVVTPSPAAQPVIETKINDCDPVYPASPFQNIALTFSGGGFRAASFSLGVLSYLNRAFLKDEKDKLINHVRYITSTSGGSITNGLYSTGCYSDSNFDFKIFYDELRNGMQGEKLLETVFDILKDDSQWIEEGVFIDKKGKQHKIKKPRNVINAFAKAYDKLLFKGKTLDCIYNCPHNPALEEVCFNATEFNNGMSFYFQADTQFPKINWIGNGYLSLRDSEVSRNIKISDIVAASSCFPGGFEPILYPNDFVHAGLTDINKMYKAVTYTHNNPLDLCEVMNKPFALMDGGIADNMGIVNVMREDQRRIELEHKIRKSGKTPSLQQQPFDLILSCDVTSYFVDPVVQPDEPKTKGISIQGAINYLKHLWILIAICIALIVFTDWDIVACIFLSPAVIVWGIYWWCRIALKSWKNSEKGRVAKMFARYFDYFLRLPHGVLIPMLKSRAASGIKLVSDLFLKQIRRGQYDNLFTAPRMVHRTISCLIYEFSAQHEKRRVDILEKKDKDWWVPLNGKLMHSDALQTVANEAKAVGTTLWFDEGDVAHAKRDKVIATGQFTVCYNLIKHICRLEVLDQKYKSDAVLQGLKGRLFEDWERFQKDPMFMI